MRGFCGDPPLIVQRYEANRATGAPVYDNKNKLLQTTLLPTNQAVRGSNLSVRATLKKRSVPQEFVERADMQNGVIKG